VATELRAAAAAAAAKSCFAATPTTVRHNTLIAGTATASCLSSKSEDVADFDYKPTACKKSIA